MNKKYIFILFVVLLNSNAFTYNIVAKTNEMYNACNKLEYDKVYDVSNDIINNLPKDTVNANFMIAHYYNALSCYAKKNYDECMAKMQIINSNFINISKSTKGDVLIVEISVKPQFYYLCHLLENKGFSVLDQLDIDKFFMNENDMDVNEGNLYQYKAFYEFKLGHYENAFRANKIATERYLKLFESYTSKIEVFKPDFHVMLLEKFIMYLKLDNYQEADKIVQKYKTSTAEDLWPIDEVSMELWIAIYYNRIDDDAEAIKFYERAKNKIKMNNFRFDIEKMLNLKYRFEVTNDEIEIIRELMHKS